MLLNRVPSGPYTLRRRLCLFGQRSWRQRAVSGASNGRMEAVGLIDGRLVKLAISLLSCAAATATLGLAAPAHALGEPGDQNASYLHSEFVEATGRGFDDGENTARRIAAQVCIDLARGRTSDQLARQNAGDSLPVDDAKYVISRAAYHFCPQYRGR